ncbi:hypothetical protein MB901379_04131 [Mycobacterium basiliense]|uniref:DUF4189 domain-containing protein n=1 Tax=Mycobacterium basiliense TaxID=2094119 RepID=A0A3S4CEK0_9MYCO|nr:DUF4189 domain-containing protein [Mycobacterium basiliense]VDM90529.1 hypothetical protein MB901379_04131 [Mycobacterium basiliense]
MEAQSGQKRWTKRRRWIGLGAAGVVVVVALIATLAHPFGPHPHKAVARSDPGSHVAMPPIPPIRPLYGAIAVADNGAAGKTWGHRSRSQAERDAMRMCAHPSCQVLSVFTRCGAIAHDGERFHGGIGHSRQVAEHDARTRLGGGWIVTSACN